MDLAKRKSSSLKGYEAQLFRDHGPDYLASKDMEDPSMPLYALQAQVPRLPVPKLADTMHLFLESSAPHVTASEFTATKLAASEFIKPGGIGHILQERLEARAAAHKETSWLQGWWNDLGYLGYRDPVVYNVSYYLQFKNELPIAMASPTRRAARFVHHSLGFRDLVVTGKLEPDMRKKVPMSNSQWKYLFNACRMPGKGQDFVRTYAPDVFTHIVVACKNRFFVFDVMPQGQHMSVDAIEQQLCRIVNIAKGLGEDENPIGVLTTANRDSWANTRELVLSGAGKEGNAAALEAIQSSMFCVCLDDLAPTSREEIGRALLHSDGKNRFFDKSWQFVFFANGVGGCIGEHSMMDGLTTTRFLNYVLDKVFSDPEEVVTSKADPLLPYNGSTPLEEPKLCEIELTALAKDAVAKAARDHHDTMKTKELKVLMFHGYGKSKIKTFKTSPDAFAQLAIQLAYYKTFGYARGTYESTQTRSFLHGRTEVTRSVSKQSVAFCRAMTYDAGETSTKKAHELLLEATKAHASYIGKASNGLGCDRHLLGLKLLLKPGEKAALFEDPAYIRSGHWALSTSGLVGELMDGWGFGEVAPDGIGVGYQVQAERLRFTITSRHRWVDRIAANLEQALLEMRTLCEKHTEKDVSKL